MMRKNNQTIRENSSPNSTASPPLKELVGKVLTKEPKKVYVKTSPFLGNTYFKLKALTEQGQKKHLFVYANVVSKILFAEIEKSDCIDKRYVFACEKRGRRLILHHWRELSNNLDTFNERKRILSNHE